ncbi:MAG TPA: DUF4340 domain-containing protein [bacterium]|nr:DUF4340 domain-containing protein [bacterium]
MKLLKSVIALIAVIVIGLLVYFYIFKAEELRKEREAHELNLIRFDLDNINSFVLARPDSSIHFERSIGRIWNITEPIKSEASGEELHNLFRSLNDSEILFTIDEKPKNLRVYGLDNTDYYMAMNYDVGNPDTLFVGNETPDGSMTYVRFASEKRVLTVDRALTTRMRWPARTYRTRTILNILQEDVKAIEIIRSDNDKIVMENPGYTWIMTYPWNLNGDNSNMKNLVKQLSDTAKTTLVEEKSNDLAQYGIDDPSLIFNVSLKFGMPDKMILVGKRLEKLGAKHLWYAKQFDNDLIYTLDNTLVTTLTYKPEWYIDKSPMKFSKENMNKIVLETGNTSILFIRDAQRNWSVVSPIDKNMLIETINKIFGCSRHILVHGLFAYDPTEDEIKKAGLDKPKIKISLYFNDTELDNIIFGNTFTEDEPNTYFRTSKSPIIYITKSPVISDINKILEAVFGD